MKKLEIELKDGENLVLEVTPLFLEYMEDYEGGINKLMEDINTINNNGYTNNMYITNQLLYAIVASNYDEHLTYRQAVRLVKIEDMGEIIDFISEELPNLTKNPEVLVDKARKHRI